MYRRLALPLAAALVATAASAASAAAPRVTPMTLSSVTVAPGKTVRTSATTPRSGEWAYRLRVSSDGEKRFSLTLQRGARKPFTVLRVPGPMQDACEGAVGSLICGDLTTPAPTADRYIVRFTNRSTRPTTVTMRVTWRATQGG